MSSVKVAMPARLCRSFSWRAGVCGIVLAGAVMGGAIMAPAVAQASNPLVSDAERDQALRQLVIHHNMTDLRSAPKLEERVSAALILLEHGWPEAVGAVATELTSSTSEVLTRRAIALALVEVSTQPPDWSRTLLEMLGSSDADLRRDVAAALGRYRGENVLNALMAMAGDSQAPDARRRGAVRALAEHRTMKSAGMLVKLAQEADAPLKPLVFESLARLTGIAAYEDDVQRWKQWWARAQKLSPTEWQAMLMSNLSARNAAVSQQLADTTARLTSVYEDLYLANPEEKRIPVILAMMGDDKRSHVRIAGLGLVERRLSNGQSAPEELRQRMRLLLTDRDDTVRLRSARLLDQVGDAPGAERAVGLLDSEHDPAVQEAMLKLISHTPTPEAVTKALARMTDPLLRSAAATVVAKALDAQRLTTEQANEVVKIAMQDLASSEIPGAEAVKLLGRLGGDDAREPLVVCLKHSDNGVRQAAAEALSHDRWPLSVLLDSLSDTALSPIVIQTIGRRGTKLPELMTLLAHEPAAANLQAWQDAVMAVAARLDTEGLLGLHKEFKEKSARWPLYEKMLVAAAAPPTPAVVNGAAQVRPEADPEAVAAAAALAANIARRRWEASYLLAEHYVTSNQAFRTNELLTGLAGARTMTDEQKHRLRTLRLKIALATANLVDAEVLTSGLLAEPNLGSIEAIAKVWLDGVDAKLAEAANQADPMVTQDLRRQAQALVLAAQKLLTGRLAPESAKRLDDLVHALSSAAGLSATPAAPPAVSGSPQ